MCRQVRRNKQDCPKRIEKEVGRTRRHPKWNEELENVLWELRTTPKVATRETPFGLVYDSELVAPTEIVVASHRVKHFELTTNDE